jgi:hypothetical protein
MRSQWAPRWFLGFGSPCHLPLVAPPAGFDANDRRYKYSSAWLAAVNAASNEFRNFETAKYAFAPSHLERATLYLYS